MLDLMSNTFPIVRKGYDPEAVEAFVQNQAEAWRGELEEAVSALEEWRSRANALGDRVAQLERQLRQTEVAHGERVAELEASVAQLTWARDQVKAELAELQADEEAASRQADAIIRSAQNEAARIVAAADEETQRWFAQARRRIELAERHAQVPMEPTTPA